MASWRPMMKIEGSGSASGSASGSISQRHGSADPHPDPDPHQNVDPQHWSKCKRKKRQTSSLDVRKSRRGFKGGRWHGNQPENCGDSISDALIFVSGLGSVVNWKKTITFLFTKYWYTLLLSDQRSTINMDFRDKNQKPMLKKPVFCCGSGSTPVLLDNESGCQILALFLCGFQDANKK